MEVLLISIVMLVAFGLGWFLAYRYKSVKLRKIENEELQYYTEQLNHAKSDLVLTNTIIHERKRQVENLDSEIKNRSHQLEQSIQQESSVLKTVLEQEKQSMDEALSAYLDTLEDAYNESEVEFDKKISLLREELEKAKAAREAINQAALRERELKEKENFYKISLSEEDLLDITILEDVKLRIRKPEAISKVIWTTYYQRGTTALCHRVLGDRIVLGIYKITDTLTGACYIGQSVNIAQRWKDHIKTALGANGAIPSNKLYSAMQENGIHNFTFEVLESKDGMVVGGSPAAWLNEKERYYIDFYQSNIYGLNVVRGNAR